MRFPVSSTASITMSISLALNPDPFPIPCHGNAVDLVDLEGETIYIETAQQLPPLFREIQDCWSKALEEGAGFTDLRQAVRERDTARVKEIWNQLVPIWDDRSFYDFVATSYAFAANPITTGVFVRSASEPGDGIRLSELDAGNPARGGDRLR